MINEITPSWEPLPIEKAISSLMLALSSYQDNYTRPDGVDEPRLVTFSRPLEPVVLHEWLYNQSLYPRLFWMNREQNFTVAGIGIADTIQGDTNGDNHATFELFRLAVATKDPHARYFGGFCFNTLEKQEILWQNFSSFSFILPLVQIVFENNTFTLSCNLWLESEEELHGKIALAKEGLTQIVTTLAALPQRVPEVRRISYNPSRKDWEQQCEKALERFESGVLEKIMLARQTVLEFSSSFSPLLFLLNYPYPNNTVYRFYLEPVKNHAFFSFTPERLYRRDGNVLYTEALAGTCAKETINGDDHHASEALLNSEKDIREHNYVREMIYNELQEICSSIEMSEEIEVLQLHRLAHLYTRCVATLKPGFENDTAVLKLLHPTPAVGGVPKIPALQHIMELEPFSRGWYAAPVGWVSRDAAEFAVAIRSALVSDNFAYLYSGAGLVKGSDPASEWEEVEQKIGDLLAITRQKG